MSDVLYEKEEIWEFFLSHWTNRESALWRYRKGAFRKSGSVDSLETNNFVTLILDAQAP
jgi:hypothetical protein